MGWIVTLTHAVEGTVTMSEPEGLSGSIISLTRHPEFKSLVKEFKSAFKSYGSNGSDNGQRDWLKGIERTYGPDAVISILCRYSDDDNFNYTTVFEGEVAIQTFVEALEFDHTLELTPVQKGFWRKFLSRLDTQVNIQSALNLDGEAVTVYSPENITLSSQVVRKTTIYNGTDGASGSDVGVDNNSKTVQVGLPIIQEEIDQSFTIPFAENSTPINILLMNETGNLTVSVNGNARIEVSSGVNIDQINVSFFVRKNAETPIGIGAASLALGSVSFCDELLAISDSHTYTDIEIDDIITVYAIYTVQLVSSDTINWTFGVDNFTLTMVQGSTFTESEHPTFLIHDVAASICDRITDSDKFYSDLIGSQYTQARTYLADGPWWNNANLKGVHLRGYSLTEKLYSTSFKKFWEGLNPMLNLGLGYETVDGVDVIRLEEKAHFFDDSSMSVLFSNVQRIKRRYKNDEYYNSIETGFSKGKVEDISGIDDVQKQTRASIFKNIGQGIKIFTDWIAQSITIEQARRTTRVKSSDYKFDDDTFVIEVTRDGAGEYSPRLNEDFTAVTGLLNEETRYNKHHTPARFFLRWINVFNGCLQNYLGTVYRFTGGEGNYDMTSEMIASSAPDDYSGDVLAENADIPVTTERLYIPIEFEIEHYCTQEEFNTIDSNRNLAVGVSQYETGHQEFFIESLESEIISGQIKMTGYFKDVFEIQNVPQGGQIVQGGRTWDATFDASFGD